MPEGKRRILCAEARQEIADLIVLMLEEKGYQVRTAQTVRETVAVAQAEPFDLFIINDGYVDGDSMVLLEKLRETFPATPALLFSLRGGSQHQNTPQETAEHYYTMKTSDFVSLVQTIDKMLQVG